MLAENSIQSVIKNSVLYCGLPGYCMMCFDEWLPLSHSSINLLDGKSQNVTVRALRSYGRAEL